MKDRYLAPDPQLIESMRAVGYTLETAVADIIDNSLTAGADQVDVLFQATPEARPPRPPTPCSRTTMPEP